jgi:hypothetical protein
VKQDRPHSAVPSPHESELERLGKFCETRVPASAREELRLGYEAEPSQITLFECRPPWSEEAGSTWTRVDVAQFQFTPSTGRWALYYKDSADEWHPHPNVAAATTIEPLLKVVDDDPTNVFRG